MIDRRANAGCLLAWALVAAFSAIIGLSPGVLCADWADFPPTAFKIYSEDGSQLVGDSHYQVERLGPDRLQLHGENHYRNGQYDIESDTLELHPGQPVPLLKKFSHVFYKPNGSVFIAGTANLQTGEAVCINDQNGKNERYTDHFDFPTDTYAGASILIPMVHALRKGITTPIRMHFFDCTPKPKLLTIEATPNLSTPGWQYYPGQLVEIQAKPDLGWLDLLAAPFLPTMHAWFNPAEGFSYVGGRINRYFYSKAHVMLVKVKPGEQIAAPMATGSSSAVVGTNEVAPPAATSAAQTDATPPRQP